ncbi:hypothetical protein KSP39_PZI011604 [Platanthera zijinensis]|uniref:Uncharacterized protein n=1 Tax=Platanthera zijinensis TaxID=2320716 RepID=A0AAP0BGB6_9ASPA
MEMGSGMPGQVPKLSKTNYGNWSIQMKVLLASKELWEVVEDGVEEMTAEAEAALTNAQRVAWRESKKKDKKALFILYQGVDEATFEKISDAETSKEAWEILQRSMQGVDKAKKVKLQSLRAQYEVMRMQSSEKVGDFVTRLRTLTNEMKRNGETIDEVSFMEKLLRSMSKKFRHVVVAIEESKDLTAMAVDELVGSLQAHEYRMLQDDEESSGLGKALQTQLNFGESSGRGGGQRGRGYQGRGRGGRGRDQGRYQPHQKEVEHNQGWNAGGRGRGQSRGQGRGQGRDQGRGQGRGGRGDMSQTQCYNCGKFGHMSYDCWSPRKGGDANHYAETSNTGGDPMMFLTVQGAGGGRNGTWYLDTGASNHMCGEKELFTSLEPNGGEVSFGDASKISVEGRGVVAVVLNGKEVLINDVFYVPGLRSNILSLGQLVEKGYRVLLRDGTLAMKDGQGKEVVRVKMTTNRLFTLSMDVKETACLARTEEEEEAWLWHHRMGHLGFTGLKLLSGSKMVEGLPMITPPQRVCEACTKGKQRRETFEGGKSRRATRPLELVHSDIAGPFETTSIGGSRYYITFTDDFSRKCWVYFLREKAEALEKFKEFRAMAEKESGQPLKVLRTDRVGSTPLGCLTSTVSNGGSLIS